MNRSLYQRIMAIFAQIHIKIRANASIACNPCSAFLWNFAARQAAKSRNGPEICMILYKNSLASAC